MKNRYMAAPAKTITAEHATAKESGDVAIQTGLQKLDIEEAAYYLWQQRGCPIGSDQEDWFRAESLLTEVQKAVNEAER